MKIDKSLYTKEEYRKLKREKQQRKIAKAHARKLKKDPDAHQINILCLKHGAKYDSSYVNKLFSACKKHCSLEFKFFCATEDPQNLLPGINVIKLPNSAMSGWWYKPWLFSNELELNGTILYLDLDVVIADNFDRIFSYKPGQWLICRYFTRAMRPQWEKFNSSVMRWEAGDHEFIYTNFINNAMSTMRRFHGDQDWIWDQGKNIATYFPDEWIRSWKWEIRRTKNFKPGGTRGNRILEQIESVTPPPECCICVFHGDPNPHRCQDPWVVKNWHELI